MDHELLAPIGPRTITRFRRVTIPRGLRDRARWSHGSAIELDVVGEQAKLIRLRSVQTGKRAKSQRAVGDRPRTVTQVGQVSIPAAVLSRVGVEVLSRVYFVGLRSRSDTVWLLPESGLAFADQKKLLDELLHESEEKRV